MPYSLATYEMSYNYLNDKTRNKQGNKEDFHMWVVDSKGGIRDNFAINNPDIKVVYKEWNELPNYYKGKIEKTKSTITNLSKKDKIELLKMLNKLDDRCLQYSVLLNVLFGYEIKVGSLGIVLGENKILWEFGNGLNESDY
jgi:hypothetical protein